MSDSVRYGDDRAWLDEVESDPNVLIITLEKWWRAVCEAVTDVLDGTEPELPKGFYFETRQLAFWCDRSNTNIDPTPLLYLDRQIRARKDRVFGGGKPSFFHDDETMRLSHERAWLTIDRIRAVADFAYFEWLGAGREPSNLTPNQVDIWRVIRDNGERMTGTNIGNKLEADGKPQGDGGLKNALATMRRLGVIDNTTKDSDRPEPRGYGLKHYP